MDKITTKMWTGTLTGAQKSQMIEPFMEEDWVCLRRTLGMPTEIMVKERF